VSSEAVGDATLASRQFAPTPRDGFALAAALFTLLLISALVTGVFFAVSEDTRASSATAERQAALLAAESAIEMTIAEWSADSSGSIGGTVTRSATVAEMGASVRIHITRLDSTLYWIVGDATAQSHGLAVSCRIGVAVSVVMSPDHSITIDRISERSWSELF
jgi:Tfp pilus assembly protein PilX